MHNLISFNQLAGWRQSVFNLERTLDKCDEQSDVINDYFNCLIECDEDQAAAYRHGAITIASGLASGGAGGGRSGLGPSLTLHICPACVA